MARLTQQQLEAHLWGAANILRGKTAGQDYKNYILSLMFYKRLCDQWECEADDAIAELEKQQGRAFSDKEKAVFRKRGETSSMPGHPLTTLVFIAICLFVVQATFLHDPGHSLIGLALTIAGLPVYLLWRKRRSNA